MSNLWQPKNINLADHEPEFDFFNQVIGVIILLQHQIYCYSPLSVKQLKLHDNYDESKVIYEQLEVS